MSGDRRDARRRLVEAREDRQQRGLARARSSDDGDELAGIDAEVEALQRLHLDALPVCRGHLEDAHQIDAQDVGFRGGHDGHGPILPRSCAARLRHAMRREMSSAMAVSTTASTTKPPRVSARVARSIWYAGCTDDPVKGRRSTAPSTTSGTRAPNTVPAITAARAGGPTSHSASEVAERGGDPSVRSSARTRAPGTGRERERHHDREGAEQCRDGGGDEERPSHALHRRARLDVGGHAGGVVDPHAGSRARRAARPRPLPEMLPPRCARAASDRWDRGRAPPRRTRSRSPPSSRARRPGTGPACDADEPRHPRRSPRASSEPSIRSAVAPATTIGMGPPSPGSSDTPDGSIPGPSPCTERRSAASTTKTEVARLLSCDVDGGRVGPRDARGDGDPGEAPDLVELISCERRTRRHACQRRSARGMPR